MSEKIWHLKRCHLFENLSPDELARLESRARVRKFARKGLIYLPADEAEAVLLLASGRVKLCSFTPDGKQAILTFIEPGELFGEMAIIDAGDREEFAEAVEPSLVILIARDEIERLMEEHPSVTLGITRLLGLRRRRIERRLKSLLFRSNRDRLVHLLLELAEQYGSTTDEGVRIQIKLSHQDLAGLIGSTRESVTVALGELQAAGHVKLARRQILLKDLALLAQSVQMEPPRVPAAQGPA